MKVRCLIKDKFSQWEEELEVKSLETAEKDVKDILDWFNSSLRPKETKRVLVQILGQKTPQEKTIGEVFKDVELVLRDLRHEVSNAYGNAWLKANNNREFQRLIKAYDKMIETGKSKSFQNKLTQVFGNVRDIQHADDLKYLCEYDFDSKLKKEETNAH